ncbi:MAG: site-specific integrase [Burkholderiales bacterium]|nr:site-specific integrase [Burkholderiales bacterium]
MKKEKMQNQTRLILRGNTYHLRVKIPADLKGKLKQTSEITRSLRTKDRREAERLLRIESVKLDEKFERLRKQPEPYRTTITDDEIGRIVALSVASVLGADEEGRQIGLSEEEYLRLEDQLRHFEAAGRSAVARGDLKKWESRIDDWLWGHGFELPRESESYRKFGYAFVKAQFRATIDRQARQRGEAVDTPHAEPFVPANPPAAGSRETLQGLFEYWEQQATRKPKTQHEFKTAVGYFAKQHGNLSADTITKAHIVAFKDALIGDGLARATVQKKLGALSAILQLAHDNDKIPFNPARGVKVVKMKVEQKARVSFSKDDLRGIFGSPVFKLGERPRGGAGDAAYWIPMIALTTGARLGEIGQLRLADLQQEDDIHFFNITDEGEGNSVKAVSSRRRVPIHPQLGKHGLFDYVERLKGDGAERLFPELKSDKHGTLTGNWSKWWGRYMRAVAVGITDTRKTFHSFRHTFKDACREAGIGQEVHDALTGHASGDNEGRRYGADKFPLKPLMQAIRNLSFDDVLNSLPVTNEKKSGANFSKGVI